MIEFLQLILTWFGENWITLLVSWAGLIVLMTMLAEPVGAAVLFLGIIALVLLGLVWLITNGVIMIPFIIAFVLTWPFLIGLFVVGALFETFEHHKMAIFTAIVAAVVAYFMFELQLAAILTFAIGYLIVGIVWSFWRFYRWAGKQVERYNEGSSGMSQDHLKRNVNPRNNIGRIMTWIVVWPFSMLENVLGDLVKLLDTMIRKVFIGIYDKITANALKDVK